MQEIALLLNAVHFAAQKHRYQRRKDEDASPYINHPIEVAEIMARVGEVSDLAILLAGVLHDTVEDTGTTFSELEQAFERDVRLLVEEVTDDKSLAKDVRKRLQIEHAPGLSRRAQQIKIADKICNVHDVTHTPPPKWSLERRREYLQWAEKVVEGCRGSNGKLEQLFEEKLREAWSKLGKPGDPTTEDYKVPIQVGLSAGFSNPNNFFEGVLMNEEIKDLIRKAAQALKEAGALEVYLFGSAAKGVLGEESDVDFAVSGLPPEKYFRAMGQASDILQRPIDLVDLDEDNPFTTYLKEEQELQRVA
jgi:predicted nucleotidyltransferase